jgi:hypothetical protein
MTINMEELFQKLRNIIAGVKRFSFGMKDEYLGPIYPTSIISFGSAAFNVNVLVIAERVPAVYLPFAFKADHFEAVTVYLDTDFEFQHYQPEVNELMGLSVLVGDPEYSYDGTVMGASEFFRNKNWSFNILY